MGGKSLQRRSTGISVLMDHANANLGHSSHTHEDHVGEVLQRPTTSPPMAVHTSASNQVEWLGVVAAPVWCMYHVHCSWQQGIPGKRLRPGIPGPGPNTTPQRDGWCGGTTTAGHTGSGGCVSPVTGICPCRDPFPGHCMCTPAPALLMGSQQQPTVSAWHGSLLDGLHTSNTESSPLPVQS